MPTWWAVGQLMMTLHITERQVYEEISPAMMSRLQFINDVETQNARHGS